MDKRIEQLNDLKAQYDEKETMITHFRDLENDLTNLLKVYPIEKNTKESLIYITHTEYIHALSDRDSISADINELIVELYHEGKIIIKGDNVE